MRYSFVHDILLVIVVICASGVLSLDDSVVVVATKPNVRNPNVPVMQTRERIEQDSRHDRIDEMTSTKLGQRLRRSLGDEDEEDPPISPTEDLLPSNCTVISLGNSLGPSRPTTDVTLKRTFCAAASKMARFDFHASAGGIYFLDTTGSECQDTVMIAWASSASSTSDACKDDPAVSDPATVDSARCLDDFFPTQNYYAAMMIQVEANQIITMLVGSFSDQCFREGKTVIVKVEHLTSAPVSPKPTETASPTSSAELPTSSPSALTESPSFLSSSSPSTSPSIHTTGSSSSSPSTSPSITRTSSPSSTSSPSTLPSINATTTTPSFSPVPQTSSMTTRPSTSPTFVQTTGRDIPSAQPSPAPSTNPVSEDENDEYEQEYEYEYEEYEFSKTLTLSPTTSPIATVHPDPITEDNAGSTPSPTTTTEEPETVTPIEDEYEYEMFSNLRSKAAQEDKARLKRHQFV